MTTRSERIVNATVTPSTALGAAYPETILVATPRFSPRSLLVYPMARRPDLRKEFRLQISFQKNRASLGSAASRVRADRIRGDVRYERVRRSNCRRIPRALQVLLRARSLTTQSPLLSVQQVASGTTIIISCEASVTSS
jgi:hypothetical protein